MRQSEASVLLFVPGGKFRSSGNGKLIVKLVKLGKLESWVNCRKRWNQRPETGPSSGHGQMWWWWCCWNYLTATGNGFDDGEDDCC